MDKNELFSILREEEERMLSLPLSVPYVYAPLSYAYKPYLMMLDEYYTTPVKNLFVGLNPGPFGMAQTGIPFGSAGKVRSYLKIESDVFHPQNECPERRVSGFLSRSEISGERFWGAVSNVFSSPASFFEKAFILNYVPLLFLNGRGANITPDKLKKDERKKVFQIADEYMKMLIDRLGVERVIAIGRVPYCRIVKYFGDTIYMQHPSPLNRESLAFYEKDATAFLEEVLL